VLKVMDARESEIESSVGDFTESHYAELLALAASRFRFATYGDIPWGSRFVLWRHDVDSSLNRALALSRLEHAAGVRATYFINPHSEFYNPFEPSQARILGEILSLGHRLGLHFDATFSQVRSDEDMHRQVGREAAWLESAFGARPDAFSLHNPSAEQLAFEADVYAGLPNCYARRLRKELGYCSDSNGYWRFRRLHDVLSDPESRSLQVLTHPEWWQSEPMSPADRMLRCTYGRAAATMRGYREALRDTGRHEVRGAAAALAVIASLDRATFERIDLFWTLGYVDAALLSLWSVLARLGPRGDEPSSLARIASVEAVVKRLLGGVDPPSREDIEACCIAMCDLLRARLAGAGR